MSILYSRWTDTTVFLCVALFMLLIGCYPQHVFYIDTDAPVTGDFLLPSSSANITDNARDAAIDTVRVDVLGATGELLDVCEFSVPDRRDWPLSFGMAPGPYDGTTFLRVRGFRRDLAITARIAGFKAHCGQQVPDGTTVDVLEPRSEVTIDRLASVPPIGRQRNHYTIRLALACMGAPSDSLRKTTCWDEANRTVPVQHDLDAGSIDEGRTTVGSSAWAKEVPTCSRPAPGGVSAICIPGGFSIMGDLHHDIISGYPFKTTPLRAIALSPFYLDQTEFTVGRMRSTLAKYPTIKPPSNKNSTDTYGKYCTWDSATNPAMPVNCISWDSARAACKAAGGDLPTEAQWEHAARGRGRGWLFPWGNTAPTCCQVSIFRKSPDFPNAQCRTLGEGPAAVGTYNGVGCPEGADRSRDGVLDMGGNVREALLDSFSPYADRCGLDTGVTRDPICWLDYVLPRASRGSDWSAGQLSAYSDQRSLHTNNIVGGFRCAYVGVQ